MEYDEIIERIRKIETDTATYWIKPRGWYDTNLAWQDPSPEQEEKLLTEIIDFVFYVNEPPRKTVAKNVDKEPIAFFQSKYEPTFELIEKTKGEIWFSKGILLMEVLSPDGEEIEQGVILAVVTLSASYFAIISIFDVIEGEVWMDRRKFLKLCGGILSAFVLGDHAYSIDTGKNSYIDKAVEKWTGKKAAKKMLPIVERSDLHYAVIATTLEKYVQNAKNLKPKQGKKPNIYLVGIEYDDPNLLFFENKEQTEKVLKKYKALVADKLDDAYFKKLNESGVQVDREAVLNTFSTQVVSRYRYSKNFLGFGSWDNTQTKVKFMD